MSGLLKLMAEDAADLEIIGAAVQDALVRVGEINVDKRARRFAMLISRFRWEEAGATGPFERIRAALSFESVLGIKSRKVRLDSKEALASLLSVSFTPAEEPPGGIVRLVLAGGGEIELEVECLDALLMDLGATWQTPRRPDHEKA
ncbi:DUF2948 family protein [Terricaulis silvestris]|uniref:DUF2948 domain-containing protein n=1 Tax=Terricaulis silvestris TaxID=2686094 RepID=A0A6I6MPL6_9CAUL|nr:DUF2948 family protein [Terricaulis silvestris]QGZ94814.1 hypothetical protein DSM104635_01646 [Terricaulis silvestris]